MTSGCHGWGVPGASSVLQGDADPAAVALPDPCAGPDGWGQIHLSVLSVPGLPSPGDLQPLESHPCLAPHTWDKEATSRYSSLRYWGGAELLQNCPEHVGSRGWSGPMEIFAFLATCTRHS